MADIEVSWQPSLLGAGELDFDRSFGTCTRTQLDAHSWVDFAPTWVRGSDELFEQLMRDRDWGQRSRRMYDKTVTEPRLTSLWRASSGEPLEPEILAQIRTALSERYDIDFDSVGFNLYRDGNDSVAWHGDRISKEIQEPVVALVSLGEPRRFLLRPRGGGKSLSFMCGNGDLLVTGGRTQRDWEHSVPKVAKAGPRMSLAYRHGLDRTIYDQAVASTPEDA